MATATVSDWLADLRQKDNARYRLVTAVRKLALAVAPAIAEEIKYGGILFSSGPAFRGIFSYTQHITLEFGQGAALPDKHQVLEGKGKGRRHIKIYAASDLTAKHVRDYIALAHAAR